MAAPIHTDQGLQCTRRPGRALETLGQPLPLDDHGVLPQPHDLVASAADKPGSARNGRDARAVPQHSRGERVDDRTLHADTAARPEGAVTPLNNMPTLPAYVFVLDARGNPLMPCHPARARELLRKGRAVPVRSVPFVIRLKDRVGGVTQPVRVCLDPGSKTTGIAVVREVAAVPVAADTEAMPETAGPERHVLWAAELTHRGSAIRDALHGRSKYRRGRRSRNLRYREQRFYNRKTEKGSLRPSLRHRLETTMSWVMRLCRWMPVVAISVERVKFDTQAMVNPGIKGIEYCQGTLQGYEIREYLLEQWKRTCAYCDAKDVPLQVEHVHPKGRGGALRLGNLAIACGPCNQRKGMQRVEDFLSHDPKRLEKILATLSRPLADAAAMNATRWALDRALRATGLPVEAASGGRTKFNRTRFGLPKTHAIDAVCVGAVGAVFRAGVVPLGIACMGRGTYRRTLSDKYGFPRRSKDGRVQVKTREISGFRTGDLVRATLCKSMGTVVGRIAVRSNGNFALTMPDGSRRDVRMFRCQRFQRADGYRYGLVTGCCHEG